jgi:hypothetical protein
MSGNLLGGAAPAGHGLEVSSTSRLILTGTITGGSASTSCGLVHASTAASATTISGTVTGGSSGASSYGINTAGTNPLTLAGSVIAGATAPGVQIGAGSVVTFNGTITGAGSIAAVQQIAGTAICNGAITGSSSGTAGYGYSITAACTATFNATITAGAGIAAHGVYGPLAAIANTNLTFNGDIYASATSSGWVSTAVPIVTNVLKIMGSTYDHVSGTTAVGAYKYILSTTPLGKERRNALNGIDTYYTFYTTDTWGATQATPSDVRYPTAYGAGGILTGTCRVPIASSVAAGALVDATVGTAVLTGTGLRTELSTELARIANCATVDSTGAQIIALSA